MKILTRSICLLLVLCFLGVALIGCGPKPGNKETGTGDNSGNNGNNAATESDTNIYGEPSFTTPIQYSELDFEGEELTVLLRNNEVTVREWYKESPEDELDEAVAMRNAAVEETLNVEINYEIISFPGWSEYISGFNGMIIDDVIQDLHYYDIAVHWEIGRAHV